MLTRRRDTPIGPETLADDSQKVHMGYAGFLGFVRLAEETMNWVVLLLREAARCLSDLEPESAVPNDDFEFVGRVPHMQGPHPGCPQAQPWRPPELFPSPAASHSR